jgi:hypothetical protein
VLGSGEGLIKDGITVMMVNVEDFFNYFAGCILWHLQKEKNMLCA